MIDESFEVFVLKNGCRGVVYKRCSLLISQKMSKIASKWEGKSAFVFVQPSKKAYEQKLATLFLWSINYCYTSLLSCQVSKICDIVMLGSISDSLTIISTLSWQRKYYGDNCQLFSYLLVTLWLSVIIFILNLTRCHAVQTIQDNNIIATI